MQHWIPTRAMILNSLKISLVVGLVLNLINQWSAMSAGAGIRWDMLTLNFLVPFCVATFSALRNQAQEVFPHYNPNAVIGISLEDGCVLYANPAAHRLLHRSFSRPCQLTDLMPADYLSTLQALASREDPHDHWQMPLGGEVFAYHVHAIPELNRAHLYLENITEREKATAQLVWQADHDTATGLPNRRALTEDLDHWLAEGHALSLGLVWVQGLATTAVRDGYLAADEVTRLLASRLRQFDRDQSASWVGNLKVYRFDGYIFALVLCSEHSDQHEQQALALRDCIVRPIIDSGRAFQLGARLGLASCSRADRPDSLIDRANTALHCAQNATNQDIVWYDDALGKSVQRQLELEDSLGGALARDEITMLYQPQVCLHDNRIVGAEALMRWQRAEGPVSPAEFIPMAERTGDIIELGAWALDTACAQWRLWRDQGLIDDQFTIAVNVSASEFLRADFVADVTAVQRHYQMPPGAIELEVTETAILGDLDRGVGIMGDLRDAGIQLAIDDFGTGYSSLSYLRRMPIHKLKVDRSFVENIETDDQDTLVVKTIIELAHGLHLTVITEGIETDSQRDFLHRLTSDQGQGYWHSRPMPPERLGELMMENSKHGLQADRLNAR